MKVSLVLNLSPYFWSHPARLLWVLAILCSLGLPSLVQVNAARADDAAAEEEEEDPLAKLTGLLDPSKAHALMSVEDEKAFRARKEPSYMRTALKSQSPNNAVEEQIKEGIKFRVERLTMPENWENMSNRTKELVNDLDTFADGSPRAREIAARAAVDELGKLLTSDQPRVVKINAAGLLGRLNIQSGDRIKKTPPVPYVPAAGPLIDVLKDSQQPLDVKVTAVRGLKRILEDGDPQRQMRDDISVVLKDELNRIDDYVSGPGRDWYQFSLVDALGTVEFPRTMTQQTYVVDALWKTMHDDTLPWYIRTRAARSLGQLRLDSSFNLPLLAHELVLLAGRMTAAYNQKPNLSTWKVCFSDLYFAFKAREPQQQQRGWGLMQNPPAASRAVIEGAYQQVLPLVNGVLKNEKPQPVPIALLENASNWMKDNTPADQKIHPQAQPLVKKKPAPATKPAEPAAVDPQVTQPASAPINGGGQ